MRIRTLFLLAALPLAAQPPASWVDPETGHRVVRLTAEPDSASLYFNQNGYLPGGEELVYTTPEGISALNLKTRAARQIVAGRARLIDAGRRQARVYYVRENAAWWADAKTGAAHRIAELPRRGSISTVNADETLLAGTYLEGEPAEGPYRNAPAQAQGHALDQPKNKGQMMEERWAARLPMAMFTMNIVTGEVKVIHRATDWLNHLLFSPADPGLLMFCHEGPWHKVDRIWTIRTDGTQLKKIHTRQMAMEIFGHEFWSADGKTIYYDLQLPRGEDFFLAAYEVETGRRTWYHLQRNEWSIHFNVSADGALFCGDGGDAGQVAKAPDGRWIYLFRPELVGDRGLSAEGLVRPGVLRAERLVNLRGHDYKLEPNVSFSPDARWVIFRSNLHGRTYVYAVEVARAD